MTNNTLDPAPPLTGEQNDTLNGEIENLQVVIDDIAALMNRLTRRFLALSAELHRKQVELAERVGDRGGAERAREQWKSCRAIMKQAKMIKEELSS
jgi:hypothetical protein